MRPEFDIALGKTTANLASERPDHPFLMKILKILGIAAGLHGLALLLIFANPGCSYTKAAGPESSPISSAPSGDSSVPSGAVISVPDGVGIRYSPTRPGTTVASALEKQPVADVTPASAYTVGKGDSLWSIAKKNQLTKAELATANNLKTTAVLHVGQKLLIPSKAAQAAAPVAAAAPATTAPSETASSEKPVPAESTRHTVKPGETLGGIARKYGVKQGEIAVANNITDPRKIQPGQELIIPARSASAAAKQTKSQKSSEDSGDGAKAPATPASDQDLDAGLKPAGASDVPVVKIDDSSTGSQKSP
jgi:LysM repeat protein